MHKELETPQRHKWPRENQCLASKRTHQIKYNDVFYTAIHKSRIDSHISVSHDHVCKQPPGKSKFQSFRQLARNWEDRTREDKGSVQNLLIKVCRYRCWRQNKITSRIQNRGMHIFIDNRRIKNANMFLAKSYYLPPINTTVHCTTYAQQIQILTHFQPS